MIKFFIITFFLIFSIIFSQCSGQVRTVPHKLNILLGATDSKRYYDKSLELSTGGDAYQFMSLRANLGANNVMLKKQKDNDVIRYQMTLIENIINTSRVSKEIKNNNSVYKDYYRGWISQRDDGTKGVEVPLYESYSFFYIAQFLYYTKLNGWYNESRSNQKHWNNILTFVENNVWAKWYERSRSVKGNHYWYFLRGRTHMGSHWAGIAMYLNAVTSDYNIKDQTSLLVDQYDTLLRRNLKVYKKGYVWNSTYDNVKGTFASESSESKIQDVSHGNHVVAYVVAAYEKDNKNWRLQDVQRLSYTFKELVYDKQRNLFKDNVDGSTNPGRPGWGNFVADGWARLADYDKEVKTILTKFKKTNMLKKYSQELQFKANLYFNDGLNE